VVTLVRHENAAMFMCVVDTVLLI